MSLLSIVLIVVALIRLLFSLPRINPLARGWWIIVTTYYVLLPLWQSWNNQEQINRNTSLVRGITKPFVPCMQTNHHLGTLS